MSVQLWDAQGRRIGADFGACRALAYGDGVFRTYIKYNSQYIDHEGQLAHLLRDAAAVGLDPMPADAVAWAVHRAAHALSEARIKVYLVRAAGGPGYRWRHGAATLLVETAPLPRLSGDPWSQGIVLDRAPVAAVSRDAAAGTKHLNRLDNVLASRDWPPGVDERLMCDEQGLLVGGTRSNLFWVSSGHVQTPDNGRAGVRGRMRARVIEACRGLGMPVAEVRETPSVLNAADEVWISNSVIGLWPVRRLPGGRRLAPGALCARLQALIGHPRWG